MREFDVEIIETLKAKVSVKADNAEAAEDTARAIYHNCEVVLEADSYYDTKFVVRRKRKLKGA